MEISQREQYTIFRRRNKLKLTDVAKYIGCSVSLLSRYEKNTINISDKKIQLYDELVKNFTNGKG